MKKLILPLMFFAGIYTADAQTNCTPDNTITETGMYPRNLPDAKAGLAYSEVIQFKFPKDTLNPFTGERINIDSVHITKVEGMPAGFAYKCNKNNRCSYMGGENGCVVITGNPTASMIKHYTVKVSANAYVKFGATSVPVAFSDTVSLNVIGASGFYSAKKSAVNVFEVKQNQPNPFSRSTIIEYYSPNTQPANFKVFDILGHVVYSKELNAVAGENKITFDRNGLKNGIYFYSVQMGNKLITKKMTIRD